MSREVLEGWREANLQEIAKCEMGETLIQKDLTGTGIPVFSANSSEGPWGWTSLSRKRFKRGTIVVGARGSLGHPRLPDFDEFVCTQTTIAVHPTPVVDPSFLLYSLVRADLEGKGAKQAVPMLTVKNMNEVRLRLPPLSQQRQIADILSSVDEAIQATQAVIEQTRIVKEGVLQRLLAKGVGHTRFKQTEIGTLPETWNLQRLSNVIDLRRGFAFRSEDYVDSGVISFRVTNVGRPSDDLGNIVRLPNSFLENYSKYRLSGGEILIVMVGATVGKLGRVPVDIGPALLNQNMWHLRPRSTLIPEFFWQYVPLIVARHLSKRQGGAYNFLTTKGFIAEQIALPPRQEQDAIAHALASFDEQIEADSRIVSTLTRIKASLVSDLLTGRVRVLGDPPDSRRVEGPR